MISYLVVFHFQFKCFFSRYALVHVLGLSIRPVVSFAMGD